MLFITAPEQSSLSLKLFLKLADLRKRDREKETKTKKKPTCECCVHHFFTETENHKICLFLKKKKKI